ncbi:MAG: TlpA family protein disulfide reductase [Chthoniobacteraceae bacterium]
MKTHSPVCVVLALAFAAAPLGAQNAPSPTVAEKSADDLGRFKNADEFWAYLEKLKKGPEKQPESRDEVVAYLKQLQSALAGFIARFPEDPRRFAAKLDKVVIENTSLASFTGTPSDPKAVEAVCKEILAEKNISEDIRRRARFYFLLSSMENGADDKLQSEIAAFCKDYPKDARGDVDILNWKLGKKLAATDPAKAEALLAEASKSANGQIAEAVKTELRLVQLRGKPFDLKFTAVDGSKVDLAKLRGKVVLVDFWATWCAPCMAEVPNVVAAYKKLHAKGFEIVGISLDQDKRAMLRVTKEKGMTWPQYFDGQGWENAISSKYGIETIPAMWLINKKGLLVNTEAGEGLEEAVEKLLAE